MAVLKRKNKNGQWEIISINASDPRVGDLDNLVTDNKTSMVEAVNEINSQLADKPSIFHQDEEPEAKEGDLWVDTSDDAIEDDTFYDTIRDEITQLDYNKAEKSEINTINSKISNLDTQLAQNATDLDERGVNVKKREMVGDGVTDNSTTFQNIVNSNDYVYIPKGTFIVGGVTISSNIKIELHPQAILKMKTGSLTGLFTASNFDVFELSGGAIVGDPTTNADPFRVENVGTIKIDTEIRDSGRNGALIKNCPNGTVKVKVREAKLSGIRVEDSSNLDIDVDIDGCDGSGVLVVPATKDVDFVKVKGTVKNCARTISTAIGVYFSSGDNYIVKNSRINVNVTDAGYIGIFPGGDFNWVVDSTVDGAGLVTPVGAHGIRVHDSSRIFLINTKATRCERGGIEVSKSHDVFISFCDAYKNKQHGFWFLYDPGTTGRYQGDATNKNVTVFGCQSNDNGTSAANTYQGYFIDGFRDITFIGCHAHDYQVTKTQQRGIRANTNAKTRGISIINCDFKGNVSGIGVLVDEAYLGQQVSYVDDEGSKFGFYGKTAKIKTGAYTAANVVTNRYIDVNATTQAEIANVLGTLINDLKDRGVIG